MNPRLLLLFALFFSVFLHGQAQENPPHVIPVTVFYDQDWRVTVKQNASFIRMASLDTTTFKFVGTVTDFYQNGSPLLQLKYGANGKDGGFQLMYSNKKLERQGFFENDKPTGVWNYYYPNGKLQQTIEFLPKGDFRVISFFDSTGQQVVKDGTGPWSSKLSAVVDGTNVPIQVYGNWKDSLKVGKWVALQADGKKVYEEEFEAGALKSGKVYDFYGKKVVDTYQERENAKLPSIDFIKVAEGFFVGSRFANLDKAKAYILGKKHLITAPKEGVVEAELVEVMPEFPGGPNGMYRFLQQHFRIPQDALRRAVVGTAVFSIVIDETGKVTEESVLKPLFPSIDKEGLRVLRLMPLWKPGLVDGQPVKVQYTIPYKIAIR